MVVFLARDVTIILEGRQQLRQKKSWERQTKFVERANQGFFVFFVLHQEHFFQLDLVQKWFEKVILLGEEGSPIIILLETLRKSFQQCDQMT